MRTLSVFLVMALAATAAPLAADVPDGKGGRTSPQGLLTPKAEVMAVLPCCRESVGVEYRDEVTNPAERKSMSHLAWVDAGEPAGLRLCKGEPARETHSSPAELKALGHVAQTRTVPAAEPVKAAGMSCCDGQAVRHCRIHREQ